MKIITMIIKPLKPDEVRDALSTICVRDFEQMICIRTGETAADALEI